MFCGRTWSLAQAGRDAHSLVGRGLEFDVERARIRRTYDGGARELGCSDAELAQLQSEAPPRAILGRSVEPFEPANAYFSILTDPGRASSFAPGSSSSSMYSTSFYTGRHVYYVTELNSTRDVRFIIFINTGKTPLQSMHLYTESIPWFCLAPVYNRIYRIPRRGERGPAKRLVPAYFGSVGPVSPLSSPPPPPPRMTEEYTAIPVAKVVQTTRSRSARRSLARKPTPARSSSWGCTAKMVGSGGH